MLSNHPQGGFITRERSNDVLIAGDTFWRDGGYDPFFRDRRPARRPVTDRPVQQPFFWRW